MYHSVTFTYPDPNSTSNKWVKNSYTDFHMVPDGRPIVATPEPVTNYITIPGASGQLDISESLTRYPTYGVREGSINFLVLNDYSGSETWQKRYQNLCRYLHGRRLEMSLEDDPDYFYEGRFKVESWESGSDGGHSAVSIGYVLDTYKYWNTLFERTITASSSSQRITFNKSSNNVGSMPAIPTFYATNVGSSGITITFRNQEYYGNQSLTHTINQGSAYYIFQDIIIMDFDETNTCTLDITGSGTLKVTLRNGEL